MSGTAEDRRTSHGEHAAAIVEQIVDDFGGRAELTQRGVRALCELLRPEAEDACSTAEQSLRQWTALFRKTCGQDWPRPKARLDRLASHYGVAFEPSRPEVVLFALHTWYVLLLKLLAAHVVAAARSRESPAAECAAGHALAVIGSLAQGGVFSALAVTDPWPGEPFDWYSHGSSEPLEQTAIAAAGRIAGYDPAAIAAFAAGGGDQLKPLYESLFPRVVRHALGEYYTPTWLAEHVLDQVGYTGQHDARLLDPTCGSGTFLLAALRRWRESSMPATLPVPSIVGFDLHPLAVAAARTNYLLAIADLIADDAFVEVPVFARDAILDAGPCPPSFDFVVGNPPWIAWDNLPSDYREATKPHWQHYGLFSLSGNEARHGGGKKDLSMLVLYATADRYLRDGGRLGMVISQTLFQSKGAGDGFRRFRIGDAGPPLGVLRVDDLVEVRPFDDASNWTSVVVLQKGTPTAYPVPYVKWKAGEAGQRLPAAAKDDLLARPIDRNRPSSPWIVGSSSPAVLPAHAIGAADYAAHLGANSGGANGVYWLEVQGRVEEGVRVRNRVAGAKRAVESIEAVIEPGLLYPLLRWSDVGRWSARPSGYLLLSQDPATRAGIDETQMSRDYPRTYAYLKRFETLLTARAAYRRYQDRQPFYSMYNVGPYTLAAAKVIWRRMDRRLRAAVVETIDDPYLGSRPVVPQETCVLIACRTAAEAHYLCALLNSSPVHELVAGHNVAGGKGFGTPSILDYVPLRKFDPSHAQHLELAALSRRLHGGVDTPTDQAAVEKEIDCLAANVLLA